MAAMFAGFYDLNRHPKDDSGRSFFGQWLQMRFCKWFFFVFENMPYLQTHHVDLLNKHEKIHLYPSGLQWN
jgi:hypothetical protein